MEKHQLDKFILKATGAESCLLIEKIQALWSGYGSILRYGLEGGHYSTVVVKHVSLPKAGRHPQGWNSDLGHQRKVRSYKVETAWYENWSHRCDNSCRIPRCLNVEHVGDEVVMVLEDLDSAGYPLRHSRIDWALIELGLSWLANFHAEFLGENPEGLWKVGTYWHLDTRPDELKALGNSPLKRAAAKMDMLLRQSPYQTFVHGDAKLENFCFSHDGKEVAMVDFQYTGRGCGMKDVAYFLSSCLSEAECEKQETRLLDSYFNSLRDALLLRKKSDIADSLEEDWRHLYPIAWADFHRFLQGWSPGYWQPGGYSERLTRNVVENILNGDKG